MNAIYKLRKNASLKSVAEATRREANKWYDQHRFWHKQWVNGEGNFHDNLKWKDETGKRANELNILATHLERLAGMES